MKTKLIIAISLFCLLSTVVVAQILSPGGGNASTTLIGTITDAQGNGINGSLTLQLPVPAQFNSSLPGCSGNNQLVQPGLISYQLVNGAIQSGPSLFDVKCLSPANLFYVATAYDRTGTLLMRGNFVVTGALFNIGSATPTTVTTSNISYANIVATSIQNTWTAAQFFTQIGSTGTPLAASGWVRNANTDLITWRNGNNTADASIGFSTATNSLFLVSGNNVSGAGACPANQFVNANNSVGLSISGAPTCAPITVLASGATGTNTALTTPTIGGTTITNVPWLIWAAAIPFGSQNASNTTPISTIVTNGGAITLKEFRIASQVAIGGCSPFPTYTINDNGSATAFSITLSATTLFSQTGSVAVASGHTLTLVQSAAGTSCTASNNPWDVTIAYQMQ